MKDVKLIAKLDDANGKCIICKKENGNYILKNAWSYGSTIWYEISARYLQEIILTIHFKMSDAQIKSIMSWR